MKVYIFIIIMVCKTFGSYVPKAGSPNVGTILFNRNDLNNSKWSEINIKLLQARKYFQNLIPPPHIFKTVNENYLDHLLTYYEDSYKTVKREVKDVRLKKIVDVAISDALGGYLKVWILPITKYGYYGGSVSMEKALHIFQAYDKIKKKLNTDGHNWRNPNENLLRSVAIDIVSRPHTVYTRSMGDPCKYISLYEKTDTDLKIPLPIINWDVQPATLILPLKNNSFTSLNSPNSCNVLLQYFDLAENCMKSQNVQNLNDFHERFQIWVSNDIIPHLNDDSLYLPFKGILCLVNKTKQLYEKICTSYNNKCEKLQSKLGTLRSLQQVSLKKYVIIAIILLIEIIWCIPSIFYIIRLKEKKKSTSKKQAFLNFFKKKPTFNMHNMSQFYIDNNNLEGTRNNDDIKTFFKPKSRNLEVDAQFPSHESKYKSAKRSKTTHRNSSCTEMKLVNEIPKSCPSKQEYDSTSPFNNETNYQRNKVCENISSITHSIDHKKGKTSDLNNSINSTIINERTIKEVIYEQNRSIKTSISTLDCRCRKTNEILSHKSSILCPCISCLEDKNKAKILKNDTKKESKNKHLRVKHNNNKSSNKYGKHGVDPDSPTQKEKTNEINKYKTNNERIQYSKVNCDARLLRIQIDKPAEIRVGMMMNVKDVPGSSRKPSKIPRLAVKNTKEALQNINKPIKPSLKIANIKLNTAKSQKTKLKQNIVDDSVIKRSTGVAKKLNITL